MSGRILDLSGRSSADTTWSNWAGDRRCEPRDLVRPGSLRELTEVKIPANQDAIGVAASYGDLSENSEWEAAMEEQRNLTSRAMAMEEELRNTGLIEEAVAAALSDTLDPAARTAACRDRRAVAFGVEILKVIPVNFFARFSSARTVASAPSTRIAFTLPANTSSRPSRTSRSD